MTFFKDHPFILHVTIVCTLLGLLLLINYANNIAYPVTHEYKNITVGERFQLGNMIVTTENVKYRVYGSDLFWNLVPNHKYRIELSYNWSMSTQTSKESIVTNATEIFGVE